MKRFSFSTFQVNESNREAFEACKAIAELQPVSPLPVVIVADDGAGKTHLLYSIVNQVRASSAKTGLAYVTAKDFPTQVRTLVKDPSPVQRAKSAILLVDQLEDFGELADELEAVVRIFLDSHHYVILASSVHPGRLKNLPEGLRALLDAGQVLQIKPRVMEETSLNTARESDPLEPDALDQKNNEVHQLRAALEKARAAISAAGDAEEVRHALELEKERAVELEADLEAERKKAENARQSIDKLRGEMAALKSEAKKNKGRSADAPAADTGTDQVRSQLEEAKRKITSLTDQLAAKSDLDKEAEGLREQLRQAAQETEQAKHEAAEVGKRAAMLLEKFQSNRAAFDQTEKEQREQIEKLQNVINEHKTSATQFETKHDEIETQLARVTQARDEAVTKLNAMAAAYAEKEQELDKLRELPTLHEKEMEALRREAAEQVAAANARGGKIEHNLKQATAALDVTKRGAREAIGGLRGLTEQLGKTTTVLMKALTAEVGELENTIEKKVEFVPVDDFAASEAALSNLTAVRVTPLMEDPDISEFPGLLSPDMDPLGSEMDEGDPFGAVPLDIDAIVEATPEADPLDSLSLDSESSIFLEQEDAVAMGDVVPGELEGLSSLTPDTVLEAPPTIDNPDAEIFASDDPLPFDDNDPLG